MEVVVQKYGGSSVASKENLEIIVNNIIKEKEKGNAVVVVVSAQGKTTDKLINLAKEYTTNNHPKEMDILLSTGELQTIALLTMMLKDKQCDAVGLSGAQAGIITDSNFSRAQILSILENNLIKILNENKVVVVAGFQGVDKFGNITTLGRGGSDLSAVAIASALKAQKCEIYTDVDGVFSGDPNVIHNASLIKNISYEEMLEAATCGAKVLHNRSVSVAKKYKLPIMVKHFNRSNGGTQVMEKCEKIEEYGPKLITFEKDLIKISLVGDGMFSNIDYLGKVYEIAKEMNVKIYMVSCNELSLSIAVKSNDAEQFANRLHDEIILNS